MTVVLEIILKTVKVWQLSDCLFLWINIYYRF